MALNRLLILVTSIIALCIVAQAEKLEKVDPAETPVLSQQPTKSRSNHVNPSQFLREKKWSLYMIPDPPYGRGPHPMPDPVYSHYPYTHPRYVLERNSYPSDDFQFFYY